MDLPILTPTLDYTIACTYPPKILLTISPPLAEVGVAHSSHCKLKVSGFVEQVQFTLRLRPPPHVQVMMAPLSQVNRRGLLPSQPDSETEHSSMGKLIMNKVHTSYICMKAIVIVSFHYCLSSCLHSLFYYSRLSAAHNARSYSISCKQWYFKYSRAN